MSLSTSPLPLRTSGRCCSDLRLDRLLCGELDDGDARALRAHLEASPRCAARLAELQADRDAFVAAPAPLRLIDGGAAGAATATTAATSPTTARTASTSSRGARLYALLPVLAAAAGLVFAVQTTTTTSDGDVVRTKGTAPRVLLHGKRGEVVRPLGAGDVVFAGDLLRLDVGTAGPRHVGVVGVDHDGVSAWIPADGDALVHVGGAPAPLPTAVALDEAPTAGVLQIVVWACEAPTSMAALVTATSTRTTPTGCAHETITLERAGGAATP
jgi:hypothetical protein